MRGSKRNTGKGILYIVATPIGNLEDITLRALDVLKSVDFIISEDTRTARKLLSRYSIEKKVFSYYSPREKQQSAKYIPYINEGKNVALISESGTPGLSDPGLTIISEAYDNGIQVIAIPGASALAAAVSVCGIDCREFLFGGFLPRKKGARKRYLQRHLGSDYALIFYESKYRIIDTLQYIMEIAPGRNVFIGREMTKKFEEIIRGPIESVAAQLSERAAQKGEFVVVCSA